ncbi:YoaK family protein [Streptomyces gamaensis]|uniref:YoaK family protein n=1 Tax=Streptomyces gamaensis TaxID=1763542 RepID=A0ABW0YX02_9ACTN
MRWTRSRAALVGGNPLPWVILALTTVSGMLDAISFLGLGKVFIGMMTGNVIVLGFAFGGVPGYSEPGPLIAIVCFVTGIVLAGRGARLAALRGQQPWFLWALLTETGLLFAATAVAWLVPDSSPAVRDGITALLSTAMGVRCATIRRLAVPDLVVTFGLTGALIALVQDSGTACGCRRDDSTCPQGRHTTAPQQVARRLGVVLALGAGAALGAALMDNAGLRWSLLVVTVSVGVITGVVQVRQGVRKALPAAG